MPMHQVAGVIFFQKLPQGSKPPVGGVLPVAQSLRRGVGDHDVHSLAPPQGEAELADAAAHLLLGILVFAGVIAPAASQPHDPHAVVLHNGVVDAVAAAGRLPVIVGIVISRHKQQRTPSHGHQKLEIAGSQISAGDDQVDPVQPAGNVEIPQCGAFLIGDE